MFSNFLKVIYQNLFCYIKKMFYRGKKQNHQIKKRKKEKKMKIEESFGVQSLFYFIIFYLFLFVTFRIFPVSVRNNINKIFK